MYAVGTTFASKVEGPGLNASRHAEPNGAAVCRRVECSPHVPGMTSPQ